MLMILWNLIFNNGCICSWILAPLSVFACVFESNHGWNLRFISYSLQGRCSTLVNPDYFNKILSTVWACWQLLATIMTCSKVLAWQKQHVTFDISAFHTMLSKNCCPSAGTAWAWGNIVWCWRSDNKVDRLHQIKVITFPKVCCMLYPRIIFWIPIVQSKSTWKAGNFITCSWKVIKMIKLFEFLHLWSILRFYMSSNKYFWNTFNSDSNLQSDFVFSRYNS